MAKKCFNIKSVHHWLQLNPADDCEFTQSAYLSVSVAQLFTPLIYIGQFTQVNWLSMTFLDFSPDVIPHVRTFGERASYGSIFSCCCLLFSVVHQWRTQCFNVVCSISGGHEPIAICSFSVAVIIIWAGHLAWWSISCLRILMVCRETTRWVASRNWCCFSGAIYFTP